MTAGHNIAKFLETFNRDLHYLFSDISPNK